jgi:tol-pal system protein YbgF
MRIHSLIAGCLAAVTLAVTAASPVFAQGSRLSLADRVARLEQQQAGGDSAQANIQLLNQISELQAEIASLRGMIEQQAFEIEGLSKRNRDQYIDLDSRINRFEGGAASGEPAAPPAIPSADGFTAEPLPELQPGRAPTAGNTTAAVEFEEPDVRAPVEGLVGTAALGGSDRTAAVIENVPGNPEDERRSYDAAFDELKEGRYAEAARRFQSFLQQYPSGEYAPNAQYWLGESYYVTQNYGIALDAFQRLLREFPDSIKSPDALLKLGYCQYELRQWDEAEATLNRVTQQYPDTTVARLAQGRLRAMRLEDRR